MINILYVAYPLLTVSEESAGGAEQVLWTLEREMMRRGYATAVAASCGSRVSCELLCTGAPCSEVDGFERRNREHQDKVVELSRARRFDLVHDMSGSFWPRAAEINTPVLVTLHLPRHFYSESLFRDVPENVRFNCVSQSQAQDFRDLPAMTGVVGNGIALDRFASKKTERKGLLWLGRICEEKAPHLALDIAERAGLPITIAGQVYPFSYHQQYFEREIASRLKKRPEATFVPSPPFEAKRRLLAEAQAVLITSLVDETSSLVAMEAAACCTPVVAFSRGALAEIVRDGVTGFLVDGIDQAVQALTKLMRITRRACLDHARAQFSSARMGIGYGEIYERMSQARSPLLVA
jgi:glycosyltransferase involved in cell wall biosynthesis